MIVVFCVRFFVSCYQCDHRYVLFSDITLLDAEDDIKQVDVSTV